MGIGNIEWNNLQEIQDIRANNKVKATATELCNFIHLSFRVLIADIIKKGECGKAKQAYISKAIIHYQRNYHKTHKT